MQSTMNLKIKFRESFRPFAPAVLREDASEYFEVPPGEDSPYMLLVERASQTNETHDKEARSGSIRCSELDENQLRTAQEPEPRCRSALHTDSAGHHERPAF